MKKLSLPEYSDKGLRKFAKKQFGDIEGFDENKYTVEVPEGYEMKNEAFIAKHGTESLLEGGSAHGLYNPNTDMIHIAKGVFRNLHSLFIAVGHETLHRYFEFNVSYTNGIAEHYSIGMWMKQAIGNFKLNNSRLKEIFYKEAGQYLDGIGNRTIRKANKHFDWSKSGIPLNLVQ